MMQCIVTIIHSLTFKIVKRVKRTYKVLGLKQYLSGFVIFIASRIITEVFKLKVTIIY